MPEFTYHHICIPTAVPRPGEEYNERLKVHASGYFQSPYGIEWMRFEPECPLPRTGQDSSTHWLRRAGP